MSRRTEADLSPQRVETLRQFVNNFSWTPQWEAEVTLSVEGLEHRLITAERFAGSIALKSHLSDAHKYRGEALEDVSALSRAETSDGKFQPLNIESFRKDMFVERALAKHLLFSRALLEDKWPVHTEPRFTRTLLPYIYVVRSKEPEQLLNDWYSAYSSSNNRHLFWLTQTRDAWLDPRTQSALRVQAQLPAANIA